MSVGYAPPFEGLRVTLLNYLIQYRRPFFMYHHIHHFQFYKVVAEKTVTFVWTVISTCIRILKKKPVMLAIEIPAHSMHAMVVGGAAVLQA